MNSKRVNPKDIIEASIRETLETADEWERRRLLTAWKRQVEGFEKQIKKEDLSKFEEDLNMLIRTCKDLLRDMSKFPAFALRFSWICIDLEKASIDLETFKDFTKTLKSVTRGD